MGMQPSSDSRAWKEIEVMKKMIVIFMFIITASGGAISQTGITPAGEKEAIVKTALDYGDGFYSGAPERMERAIPPDLNKVWVRVIPPPRQAANPAVTTSVMVPEGNGAPVITDGIFSPGEWDDALPIALNESITLYLKDYRGVVFIGVRGRDVSGIGPSDLFLTVPGAPIQKLHVSAQLSENVVPATGAEPPVRFGLTTGWYANELRRDMAASARLEKEGKSPIDIIRAASYPSDGIEFAIRRSKFPGRRWLMRLFASAIVEGKPGMLAYPTAAAERTTEGWLELHFK
jgi:hypothetical protein